MDNPLQEFADEFDRCWLCGAKAFSSFPHRLEIHHMVRGVHRAKARNERCTFIRTCFKCHAHLLDSMPLARQLAIKRLNDASNYDRVRVNTLRGRAPDAVSAGEVHVECLAILYPVWKSREWPFRCGREWPFRCGREWGSP